MFRFWVAGAAFFSLMVSSSAAELSASGATSAPTTTDLSFGVTMVTPTNNSSSRFSGATGMGTVVPLNQTWSTATPRPISFSSSPTPEVTNRSLIVNDPSRWTDAQRSVNSFLRPGSATISSPTLTPAASYFAPAKTTLFAAPQTMH